MRKLEETNSGLRGSHENVSSFKGKYDQTLRNFVYVTTKLYFQRHCSFDSERFIFSGDVSISLTSTEHHFSAARPQ